MPALPPVPGVLKVTYEMADGVDFHAICRSFHAYVGGPPSAADCTALALAIYNAWVAHLLPFLPNQSEFLGVTVTDLSSPLGNFGEHLATVTGTRAGSPVAGGTAVLVNAHILRRYRGGKPRTYWPFFSSADLLTLQTWTNTSVAALQTALTAFYVIIDTLLVGTTQLSSGVNVSYYSGFTTRPDPPIPGVRAKNISTPRLVPIVDVIASRIVNASVASQRRRNLTA